MRNFTIVLGCLACMGRGRRVQSSSQRLRESPVAQDEEALQSHDILSRARTLAILLLASNRAVAFNPCTPGVSDPRNPFPQMNGLRKIVQRTDAQTQAEETIAKHPVVLVTNNGPESEDAMKKLMKVTMFPPKVNVDDASPADAADIQDHMERLTGFRKLPLVWIGRRCIGGVEEMSKLNETGELKTLVADAWDRFNAERKGDIGSLLNKSEEEWQKELRPRVYKVLRKGDMEMPRSHDYWDFLPEAGHFECKGCPLPLYSAASKFESSPPCGWPTFDKCYHSEEIGCHVFVLDNGSPQLQLACTKCSCRLGYLYFDDERESNPTGERHAVNGISLKYQEEEPTLEDVWEDGATMVYANQ